MTSTEVSADGRAGETDRVVSQAVVACLADPEDLTHPGAPAEVLAALALIDEALAIHPHWDTTSPVAALAIVKAQMRRRHGELSEDALQALATHCTRDFRH